MIALSVRQPHAALIASGNKKVEYRSWSTRHRGPLLVVASQTLDPEWRRDPPALELPRGVAVCVVKVTGCREDDDGGYSWLLANPRRVEPVPLRGYAALFHVADDRIRYLDGPAPTPPVLALPEPAGPRYTLELETGVGTGQSAPLAGLWGSSRAQLKAIAERVAKQHRGRTVYLMGPSGLCFDAFAYE